MCIYTVEYKYPFATQMLEVIFSYLRLVTHMFTCTVHMYFIMYETYSMFTRKQNKRSMPLSLNIKVIKPSLLSSKFC
jgi:hypothetical protein